MFIFLPASVNNMKWILIVYFCFAKLTLIFPQFAETEIGEWREHVPYSKANSVAADGDIIYCGSSSAFVAFNSVSGEVKRFSTISGLSDIGVRLLKFNSNSNSLLIAYKNGNMDILKGNKIINVPSVRDANLIGDKTIYNIRMQGGLAYVSTGFGIVVVNMEKAEVKDTYLIGDESNLLTVNDVYINNEEKVIYAATVSGIRFANTDDNLSDYNVWSKADSLPFPDAAYNHIDFFSGKLFINMLTNNPDSDIVFTVENNKIEIFEPASYSRTTDFQVEKDRLIITKLYNVLVYDEQLNNFGILYNYEEGFGMNPSMAIHHKDLYWIADNISGLVKFSTLNIYQIIAPDGPNTESINDIDIGNNILWTSSGIHEPDYRFSYNLPEFNSYIDNTWKDDLRPYTDKDLDSLYGFVKIVVNPFNTNQVFAGSWDNGMIEILNGKVNRQFNDKTRNETDHTLTGLGGGELIRVGGMVYDENQNLWVTCSETPYALNVMDKDGNWLRFYLGNYVDQSTIVGEVIIDRITGYKWILLNRSGTNFRIVVYDDNGTPFVPNDDRYIALATDAGSGNIPGSAINCLAQDKGGAIWIGTNEGPAVYFSTGNVFDDIPDAQRIFVQQDGQTQILLETENIQNITVDGADRKWFGTSNSGAFLMSSDGSSEILHFTTENSPLFSNEVNEIAINGINGEVYFCTSEGLISYKGTATTGGSAFGDVQVFPNPVDRNYSGPIAIRGLAENANVKITDANGLLIYETNANGGQAIWDGYSLTGSKARNGVYLIFCTDSNGENQEVTKLLYLNN